jgi:predicted SPOUT superfamily RNA methylase MTH1
LKRRNSITIAIPSSTVSELNHLRDKTTTLGQIGRAAAIYRVNNIIIFRDKPDESMTIKYILGYLETPQYLRKLLFTKRPELQYAGILPPLKTPHHPTVEKSEETKIGEYREGITTSSIDNEYYVNVGLDKMVKVKGKSPKIGRRITTQLTETKNELLGRRVRKKDVPIYWGYDLRGHKGKLCELVLNPEWDLTIATSRTGTEFTGIKSNLKKSWSKSKSTLIVFGSHKEGIKEILEKEGVKIDVFDYNLNMIPYQGTKTVRTEEAVLATLAVLNLLGE